MSPHTPQTARTIRSAAPGLLLPGHPGWDRALPPFNTNVVQHPTALGLPRDASEVAAIVAFARDRGLRVAPQATGHNAAPLGSLDGTVLLQTSQLEGVTIDAAANRVRVGSATKWEKVTPGLSEHGLAGLHGSSPDVGIAGYSLGGGMGWLARKYGLQTNSVTAIELVTADGELIRADHEHHPDLFWALRGGGGSFGVVTAIEFDVYPVEELYAGAMFFAYERSSDVLHAWSELLPTFPDELMTWANLMQFPPIPDVPEPVRGKSFAIVMAAFLGSEADGRALLAPIRALGPQMDTFAMVDTIELGELAMDPPDPLPIESTTHMLEGVPADAIDALLDAAGPDTQSPLSMVNLRHMGGALARREPHAGARATLPGEVSMFSLGVTPDPQVHAAVNGYLADVHDALLPYRAGDYPNFVEEPADASTFFDEVTWARLRRIKAQYDPADVFRGNHHVPPAG